MPSMNRYLLSATLGLAGAFKLFPINPLSSLATIVNQLPLGFHHNTVSAHAKADPLRFQCDLAHPLDPSADGLYSSHELFSNEKAIKTLIRRHQPLVKVESVCYDDLGDFSDDRWKPFYEIPSVLQDKYPLM